MQTTSIHRLSDNWIKICEYFYALFVVVVVVCSSCNRNNKITTCFCDGLNWIKLLLHKTKLDKFNGVVQFLDIFDELWKLQVNKIRTNGRESFQIVVDVRLKCHTSKVSHATGRKCAPFHQSIKINMKNEQGLNNDHKLGYHFRRGKNISHIHVENFKQLLFDLDYTKIFFHKK